MKEPTYHSWMAMRRRCYEPAFFGFQNYGGRGITVCDRWRSSYQAFKDDMGTKPVGMSLDRINLNGNYELSNCRWATRSEQNRNRRSVRLTPSRVTLVRWLVSSGMLHREISEVLGLTLGMVSHAAYGTAWSDGSDQNLRRRKWARRSISSARHSGHGVSTV